MQQRAREPKEWTSPKELSIVFDYYCRLNSKRLKHTVLEDFNVKAATMDLHEFMTFCKNFQITSKQQKKTDQNVLAQFLGSKSEDNNVKSTQPIQKNDKIIGKEPQNTQQTVLNEREQIDIEQQMSKSKQNQFAGLDGYEELLPKIEERIIIKPSVFLSEKRLSQIFKKYTSNSGQINFQIFISIMKIIANQMFNSTEPKSNPKQTSQKQSSTSKLPNENYLKHLMVLLHLDTTDHIIQTFTKVNQFHGNMEHLSLLRSPIKKIHIKNNPLGKYAKKSEEKENVQIFHSRMVLKGEKSMEKLPKLGKFDRKKELITYAKTQQRAISNQQLNIFFLSNKNQLQQLNRSLVAKSTQTSASRVSHQKEGELLSPNNCKSLKKYTQLHHQKLMCDIKNRQIANLIDSSSLYDDPIFNKYIQLNYKQPKKQNHPKQSRW